jgi:4-hydroxyacetophenone monooxygenase
MNDCPHDSLFSEETVKKALAVANPNVLRMALYQITRDPELAEMRVEHLPVRNGAMKSFALRAEHHEEVRRKALAYIARPTVPTAPTLEELRYMMSLFTAEPLSDKLFALGLEELALDDFPRDVQWTSGRLPNELSKFRVAVIGAGISGIAAAVMLERLRIPYVVIERQAAVGGTWQLNVYPEARVDTSSYLYQFKFEKNYPWPEFCSSQAETRRYLERVAAKHGVLGNVLFNREVSSAIWNEQAARWDMTLKRRGEPDEVLSANVIFSASGLFSTPNMPDIPGIGAFNGRILHTAQWDSSYDIVGKRIGLIGNGSSGVQIMPHLAAQASALTVYQRTPGWIAEMEGYKAPVPAAKQWLFDNIPFYWNWFSYSSHVTTLGLQDVQTYDPEWRAKGGKISQKNDALREGLEAYIRRKLGDREDLIVKSIPSNAPLGRRLVVDNGWYDALLLPNVTLVTQGIQRFTESGIITRDGTEREHDLVVLGAGFQTSRYLWPVKYRGRAGVTLEQAWKRDGARAYLGMTMPHFPNLFMFYGPNSQPRTGGFSSWAELWTRYSVGLIVAMIEAGGRSVECRKDVFESFNEEIDEASKSLLWEIEGGSGYYVNEFGRSAVNMPFTTDEYHHRVATPKLSDYDMR